MRTGLPESAVKVTIGGYVPGTDFNQRRLPDTARTVQNCSTLCIENIKSETEWGLVVSKVRFPQVLKNAVRTLSQFFGLFFFVALCSFWLVI